MHGFPVVLLFWVISVTALPPQWEDEQDSAEDYLEDVRIQNSIPKPGEKLNPRMGLHLDPEVLLVNKFSRGFRKVAKYSPVARGSIWRNKDLTYRIVNFGRNLSPNDVVFAIEHAFKLWSDVTPLTFTRVFDKGDIELEFVTGDHKDNNAFDPGTEYLAHAFQPGPNIGGDVHFNDDKRFTKTSDLYNLFLVAAHEIGHALGLQHSNGLIDLMNDVYQATEPRGFRLSQNDIDAIQRLYGRSPKNPFAKGPSICDPELVYDAATTLRGDIFFFTERFVLRRSSQSNEVNMDYIQKYWDFLPNNVDAAYENTNFDTIMVFKGSNFWEISNLDLKNKGSIHHFGIPPSEKAIDAAVFVESIERTYFFVGIRYWRYNERIQAMDEGFPRFIAKDIPGVGPKINAAMYYNERIYLFDNFGQHEVEIDANGQIAGRIQKLPKNYWLGC